MNNRFIDTTHNKNLGFGVRGILWFWITWGYSHCKIGLGMCINGGKQRTVFRVR